MLPFLVVMVTVATLLLYRARGLPALGLIGLAGCLLVFRALPESLGSVVVILCVGWALARLHTVDYERFLKWRRSRRPPLVTFRRSVGASTGYVCAALILALVAPRFRHAAAIVGVVGIEILVAHVAYFGFRDEVRPKPGDDCPPLEQAP
jgi:hypothetical protein